MFGQWPHRAGGDIENIDRNLSLGHPLEDSILTGAQEVGLPTAISTLAICSVFLPIFLLQGTAKYLFSPLAVSVIASLVASLALSFTVVPMSVLAGSLAAGRDWITIGMVFFVGCGFGSIHDVNLIVHSYSMCAHLVLSN